MTIFNKRKVCGTLPYMKPAKRLWRLLSENNIVYDIFKFAMFSVWSWFFGLVTVAFLMFHGWLKAQPLGFFAMLLIFALAFLLAAAALISRDKAQLNLPLSKYKMIGIGALLFLGVPILLFGLSRVPLTDDQIQIAWDEQPKPKLEEPKIEKLTAEATPELEKKSPKEVELQSKRGIIKESEPAKETIISQLEAAEPPLIPPGTRIEQRSEGPNSPNIIGNHNQVNINPKPSPRRLSASQKDLLASRLSELPKTNISILRRSGGVELQNFADDFVEVFKRVGWSLEDLQDLTSPNHTGMVVVVRDKQKYPKAADTLWAFISEMGLQVQGAALPKLKTDEVRLVVGPTE